LRQAIYGSLTMLYRVAIRVANATGIGTRLQEQFAYGGSFVALFVRRLCTDCRVQRQGETIRCCTGLEDELCDAMQIVAGWNGMAIQALASASVILQQEDPPQAPAFPVEGCPPSTYLQAAIQVPTVWWCCAVLCCAVLCCAVLSCAVLCCPVLSCPVLYCRLGLKRAECPILLPV